MQPTESRLQEGEAFDGAVGRLVVAARHWLRLPALLVWVGVLAYSRFRLVMFVPYTVGLVGAAVGLTLIAALLESDRDGAGGRLIPATGRRSNADRLLLVGCLVGLTAGTAGVVSAAGGIPASQPQFADSALIAAALVVGSLFVLVGRWFGPVVAGLAVFGIGVGWLAAPANLPLIETMVYDSRGIYGPLTRAAASWIAPACLLAGLWRTSGTVEQLRSLLPTIAVSGPTDEWLTSRQLTRGLWQLTPPVGVVALLIAWLTPQVDYLHVLGVAVVPAAVCWLGLLVAGWLSWTPIEFEGGGSVGWRGWGGPLVVAGGPLAVMAVLLVVARLPLGTVLLVGNLLVIGLCLLGPLGGIVTDGTGGLRTGIGTVLDGSIVGIGLFARVAVLLAVVGGITAVLQPAVSTGGVSALLWLSGRTLLALVVLGGCCVVLGLTLPVVAGYATGAVLIVPLIMTLTAVPELTAHVVVWYAVVGGWLVAPAVGRRLRTGGQRLQEGWKQ